MGIIPFDLLLFNKRSEIEEVINMECTVLIMVDERTGFWVARGLEYDICAQGDSPKEAIENFGETVCCEYLLAEQAGKSLREKVPQAPDYVWDIYRKNSSKNLPSIKCADLVKTTPQPSFMLNPCLAT